MILDKRIMRDFKANIFRSISMILIISLSVAMIVALCSAADCITETLNREWKQCNVEDGSFETYIPLSKRNYKDLSELNVIVEKMFYTDIQIDSVSELRIFANRKSIDLPYVENGVLPNSDNEIFLEKKFASSHGFSVGDSINIGTENFYISGTGCLPDYTYVKKNSSDVAGNDEFSLAVVSDSAWDKLSASNRIIYNYAYKLGKGCTVKEFKDKLADLKFDSSSIKDVYLKSQAEQTKNAGAEFDKAAEALQNGVVALADGIDALGDASGIDTGALYDGALGIYAGVGELRNQAENYLGGSSFKTVNLSSFGETKYNIRINDAADDSQVGKQAALVVGIFLIVLLVYMISIFAVGTVEKERPIIGTLYALGYSRREILLHYMKLPMLIAFLGALIGTFVGFSLTDAMASSSAGLYSFPEIVHIFPVYLLVYAIGLPITASYIINRFALSKKLNVTPLKMMRDAPQKGVGFNIKTDGLSFSAKYKLRQFLRELSGNVTLFFGIVISILLIMFSLACYSSIKGYIDGITDDIHYNYMYILRNPVNDLPKNPVVGYARGLYTDFSMTSTEMEVTMLGIGEDNPYFDFAGKLEKDKLYMSDSARIKFGYKPGDKIVFKDNSEDKYYAFEIAGEVKYGSGLYFFMNLDSMRKSFGLDYFNEADLKKGERRPKPESYYYNTVFSDSKLNFKHNMLLSQISKVEMKSGAEKFMTLMSDMIVLMIVISVIIFVSVMYLLLKLQIDRSTFSISLLKALGYDEKTVNSFYLSGSFYIMLASVIIGIPLCRVIVGLAYPFCISNVNAGFEASVSPLQYVIIILLSAAAYFAAICMPVRYLKKIKLTEILKNRE